VTTEDVTAITPDEVSAEKKISYLGAKTAQRESMKLPQ
jgi:hypothetical protein